MKSNKSDSARIREWRLGCGGCLLGVIAVAVYLIGSFLLYQYSMMNLDTVADDVAKALDVSRDDLVYVGGGRNSCKVVAFEYVGDKTRLVEKVKYDLSELYRLDQEYLTIRLRLVQRYYKVLEDFDSESPDMHIYELNGMRYYVLHDRVIVVAVY